MTGEAKLDQQRASVVALGSFNPAIFHPVWFAKHELIREAEAENARLNVMSSEVTSVEFEWFTLQVTSERFAVETTDPRKYQPLRDLVMSTFSVLEHTPIRAFGFNNNQLFLMSDEESWHQLGHHFAPKKSWSSIIDSPGLKKMTMLGTRDGSKQIQITLESTKSNGVFININEHYNIPEDNGSQPSSVVLIEALSDGWNGFLEYSMQACAHLIKHGEEQE